MSAKITASMVKELRERTGAGMMECKKALVASEGSIDAAIEAMRKSGQAKADKKAGRVTAEGLISIAKSADNKTALMLEVNCETDFVARDENLVNFVNLAASLMVEAVCGCVDEAANLKSTQGKTIEELRQALILKVGENVQLRRAALVNASSLVGAYSHGARIGVLVALNQANDDLAKDVAMHVAATNPTAIAPEDVPADLVEKEKDIFIAQAEQSGKPREIIDKMITGRMKKFLSENSLLGQAFVKNPDQTVAQLLKTDGAIVESMVRFEVGEGIEKKEDNFVEEVMAQVSAAS